MVDSSRASEQALAALNRAALAIASEVSVEKVLQQITDSARELVGARYAALGVPDSDNHLEKFVTSGMATEDAAQIPHQPRALGLLGAIMHEGRTIRVPHVTDDPRSVGYPPGHPPMETFLGVPIMAGRKVLGNLYLTDKIPPATGSPGTGVAEFTAADQELVEMFAAHAAIAIQNARLYEQIGRLAIIEERSRIGMDLHDGVIQSIYAVGLTLESARLLLPDEPDEASAALEQLIDSLNDVIRDIRNFILDLRPQRFSGDLNQALARLVREFQANAMVPVTFSADSQKMTAWPLPVARTIFLTTQEALANVARHARADQVEVAIWGEAGAAVLTISDDGVGFNVEEQAQSVGHGLANMRTRAEELNGTFGVESTPGEGTEIRLQLPTDN
ncbi:MAG: GAF domain-containing sensor histidine kinase [Gammaproteobacteria bacterium]|nr:MAG: GAF domain-containing sensor histidine kinase [Gammaproteobacteria bacterium]